MSNFHAYTKNLKSGGNRTRWNFAFQIIIIKSEYFLIFWPEVKSVKFTAKPVAGNANLTETSFSRITHLNATRAEKFWAVYS